MSLKKPAQILNLDKLSLNDITTPTSRDTTRSRNASEVQSLTPSSTNNTVRPRSQQDVFTTPKSYASSPNPNIDNEIIDLNSPTKNLPKTRSSFTNLSSSASTNLKLPNFKLTLPTYSTNALTAPSSARNSFVASSPAALNIFDSSKTSKNIKVICRFRPLISEELKNSNFTMCANYLDDTSVEVTDMGLKQQFTFDRIFGPNCLQEEIYDALGRDIVLDILQSYNATVFSYGQTSAGKTYTMQGILEDPAKCGLIPRIVTGIYDSINNSPNVVFTIKVSMIEIYLEKVYDLFDLNKSSIKLRETVSGEVILENLTETMVNSFEEVINKFTLGCSNRRIAATKMNAVSSRSHSIFIINVLSNEDGRIKSGKLYLVDLAGSEKISKTGVEAVQLSEAKQINKSLSALGNVINALTDGSSHIPYRDSKLTRILQQSIGGNARTSLIINCSPATINAPETLSTLRFGTRAKKISNTAKVNVEMSATQLKSMLEFSQAEVIRLQDLVNRYSLSTQMNTPATSLEFPSPAPYFHTRQHSLLTHDPNLTLFSKAEKFNKIQDIDTDDILNDPDMYIDHDSDKVIEKLTTICTELNEQLSNAESTILSLKSNLKNAESTIKILNSNLDKKNNNNNDADNIEANSYKIEDLEKLISINSKKFEEDKELMLKSLEFENKKSINLEIKIVELDNLISLNTKKFEEEKELLTKTIKTHELENKKISESESKEKNEFVNKINNLESYSKQLEAKIQKQGELKFKISSLEETLANELVIHDNEKQILIGKVDNLDKNLKCLEIKIAQLTEENAELQSNLKKNEFIRRKSVLFSLPPSLNTSISSEYAEDATSYTPINRNSHSTPINNYMTPKSQYIKNVSALSFQFASTGNIVTGLLTTMLNRPEEKFTEPPTPASYMPSIASFSRYLRNGRKGSIIPSANEVSSAENK